MSSSAASAQQAPVAGGAGVVGAFLLLYLAAVACAAPPPSCGGEGDVRSDWLTSACASTSALTTDVLANGSTLFTLSNGIVARSLLLEGGLLSTRSVRSLVGGGEKLAASVAEAALEINGAQVWVGGGGGGAALRATSAGVHRTAAPRAGEFAFTPGARGSPAHKPWPPAGVRAEFDHTLPCAALPGQPPAHHHTQEGRAAAAGPALVTATIVYELYDGTSTFGKRVLLQHNCSSPLYVFNMSVSMLALRGDRLVETFTDASISEGAVVPALDAPAGVAVWVNRFLPIAATHAYDASLPAFGPGLSAFAAGANFTSYLVAEVVHDAPSTPQPQRGMSRFGLEASRMWRTLAPQTEQLPVTGNAMCVGGAALPAGDPRRGSWCYDAAGTAALQAYIDDAASVGVEMVHVSLNMNGTWRSQVGVEFQGAANVTWFAALVARARAAGLELGAYQLLRNARSAAGANECAPDDAASSPLDGYDDQDLPPPLGTGRACHNGGAARCAGGPGCCSLCAANEWYDAMEASVLAFWDATGMTVTEQDGAESDSPCANASHSRHHGLNDSVWVKWGRVHDTFRAFAARGGWVQGMPGHWLEGGQAKVPGGYDEMTWSLPRWTWLARQRERIMADPQQRDRTEPNALRYFCAPFSPYHPLQVLPGGSSWAPVDGLESTATLEPLEEHTLELAWALSQSFGTGVHVNLRGPRLFAGPASKAVVAQWVAWAKRYRAVLAADFVTIHVGTACWGTGPTTPTSTCNVSSWDGLLHRAPAATYPGVAERGLAVLWNAINATTAAHIALPLYYAGLDAGASVLVRRGEGAPMVMVLDANHSVAFDAALAPYEIAYFVVTEPNGTSR